MREQVEGTVERILSLKPERILEIGCGTGLVLFRVAPYCNQYCATDMSQFAIDYVARHLGNLAERVELRQALADDFSFVEPGSFDVVVLNSVVQYFPGARYLERVLNQALRALRKGGSIFVGDVRSFELSQAFYASVELSRAPSQATSGDIRQRAARRMREEAELLVSPGWFKRFSVDSEENVGAAFQLKRGRILNELTRFRYDVVLQTGIRGQLPDALEERQWNAVGSLQTLEEALRARPTSRLVVRSIPNARLDDPLSTLQWVETAPATASVRERLDRSHNLTRQSVDPEDLWRLARETGYVAQVVWAGGAQDGYIDVLFQPDSVEPNPVAPHWQRVDHARPEPWYINSPQENETAGRFVSTLREYLRDRLPEYLRPSFVVVLDALPLSANGKVDRRRLPAPRESLVMLEGRFVPPRTRLERLIAQVWQRVLGIETVGAHDNFFDLGGHSLLMVRAHEELCETWTEPLAITDLFRFPTVRSLAAFLDPQSAEQENSIVIEDRAGRQRSNMARRPPRSSSYETPNTKPGAADGNEPAVTQTKLHPVEVSRIKEAVAKWRSFRNV
jgi:SAM-dependent methyltransferase